MCTSKSENRLNVCKASAVLTSAYQGEPALCLYRAGVTLAESCYQICNWFAAVTTHHMHTYFIPNLNTSPRGECRTEKQYYFHASISDISTSLLNVYIKKGKSALCLYRSVVTSVDIGGQTGFMSVSYKGNMGWPLWSNLLFCLWHVCSGNNPPHAHVFYPRPQYVTSCWMQDRKTAADFFQVSISDIQK